MAIVYTDHQSVTAMAKASKATSDPAKVRCGTAAPTAAKPSR
jgi:hypothetical protein